MKYTPQQRTETSESAIGKTVESLDYDEDDNYWVMTFNDGTETCFRFMAELQ